MSLEHEPSLALLLRQAERRVTARLSALLTERGSSLEHWHVLSCLADSSGRPISEIGATVMIPPPTMSKLIDAMVALNLVYRRADARDRRRVLVFLSARGRRLHQNLSAEVEQHEAELQGLHGVAEMQELTANLLSLIQRLDSPPPVPVEASALT